MSTPALARSTDADDAADLRRGRSSRLPGMLLGLGLGGFVDGIVLHQLLQWHHMLSSTGDDALGLAAHPVDTVAGLEVNTLWDGAFHAFAWLCVVAGLAVLSVQARRGGAPRPARSLWGWVLVGWGTFDLVEGVVDHHLLRVHHVRAGPDQLWWDLGFLALGAVLVGGGRLLQRGRRAG